MTKKKILNPSRRPCRQAGVKAFVPGTVYRFKDAKKFRSLFGISCEELLADCHKYKDKAAKLAAWKAQQCVPVLIELSPVCDVHQGKRQNALLLGGIIFKKDASAEFVRTDSIDKSPVFSLRWPGAADFPAQSVFLANFSRLKTTMRQSNEPHWLVPWFRLRELPTASLRNWHSSHASRIGYVSLQ